MDYMHKLKKLVAFESDSKGHISVVGQSEYQDDPSDDNVCPPDIVELRFSTLGITPPFEASRIRLYHLQKLEKMTSNFSGVTYSTMNNNNQKYSMSNDGIRMNSNSLRQMSNWSISGSRSENKHDKNRVFLGKTELAAVNLTTRKCEHSTGILFMVNRNELAQDEILMVVITVTLDVHVDLEVEYGTFKFSLRQILLAQQREKTAIFDIARKIRTYQKMQKEFTSLVQKHASEGSPSTFKLSAYVEKVVKVRKIRGKNASNSIVKLAPKLSLSYGGDMESTIPSVDLNKPDSHNEKINKKKSGKRRVEEKIHNLVHENLGHALKTVGYNPYPSTRAFLSLDVYKKKVFEFGKQASSKQLGLREMMTAPHFTQPWKTSYMTAGCEESDDLSGVLSETLDVEAEYIPSLETNYVLVHHVPRLNPRKDSTLRLLKFANFEVHTTELCNMDMSRELILVIYLNVKGKKFIWGMKSLDMKTLVLYDNKFQFQRDMKESKKLNLENNWIDDPQVEAIFQMECFTMF